MWSLHLNDDRMRHTGIVFLYVFLDIDCGKFRGAGRTGRDPIYGCKIRQEEDGSLQGSDFLMGWAFSVFGPCGEVILREAQIRYELDGYDKDMQRFLSVICSTGAP